MESDKTEGKKKWFEWHLFPEDPINIKSVVEVIIFTVIVSICGFLYYRWNQVPVKEVYIEMEDLSDGRLINYSDTSACVLASNVKVTIPMTSHQELIKDSSSVLITYCPLHPYNRFSDIVGLSFYFDSLRNEWGKDSTGLRDYKILKKYDISLDRYKIDNKGKPSKFEGDYVKYKLDSLRKFVSFKADSFFCAFNMWKISISHFNIPEELVVQNETDRINYHGVKKNIMFDSTYVYSDKYTRAYFGCATAYYNNPFRWYNIFDIYYPFVDVNPMTTPRWGRLEDISQSYVNLKLNSCTIDSIQLTIDFVGVTEFSRMNPEPDIVNMNSIVFTDPVKLYKIRNHGLQFHAKFVELQNFQQIRVFSVTAIMSAFVLGFVVFIINAYFKLRKRYLLGQVLSSSLKRKLVKGIFIVIPMYIFIYWTSIYFIIPHFDSSVVRILLCNIITFFVIFVVLSLFDSNLRKSIITYIKVFFSSIFSRLRTLK